MINIYVKVLSSLKKDNSGVNSGARILDGAHELILLLYQLAKNYLLPLIWGKENCYVPIEQISKSHG